MTELLQAHVPFPPAGLNSSNMSVEQNQRARRIGRAEWLVLASIALCVLDGAIRKWVLRDDEGVLKYVPYFSKDIAFALVLVGRRPQALGELGRRLWTFLK